MKRRKFDFDIFMFINKAIKVSILSRIVSDLYVGVSIVIEKMQMNDAYVENIRLFPHRVPLIC